MGRCDRHRALCRRFVPEHVITQIPSCPFLPKTFFHFTAMHWFSFSFLLFWRFHSALSSLSWYCHHTDHWPAPQCTVVANWPEPIAHFYQLPSASVWSVNEHLTKGPDKMIANETSLFASLDFSSSCIPLTLLILFLLAWQAGIPLHHSSTGQKGR